MMNVERLRKLAEALENVPKEQFNLSFWGGETLCGFAGCAVGWACQIPELQAQGLSLQKPRFENFDRLGPRLEPDYNGLRGYAAAEEFFGLTNLEANYLFNPNSYPAGESEPKHVGQRIRELAESM